VIENSKDAPASAEDQPMTDALAQHHRGLEGAFDAIVAKAEEGDPLALRAAWTAFEAELVTHLDIEERDLLPLFERSDPGEGEALRAEHEAIRASLFELGLSLDLHQLQATVAIDFVAGLRAHARREGERFYPWIERNLAPEVWHSLGHVLSLPRDASWN